MTTEIVTLSEVREKGTQLLPPCACAKKRSWKRIAVLVTLVILGHNTQCPQFKAEVVYFGLHFRSLALALSACSKAGWQGREAWTRKAAHALYSNREANGREEPETETGHTPRHPALWPDSAFSY